MSKIYIAAPLSTKEHKKNNEKVAKFLRFCGHEVYLPQEFHVENAYSISNEEWARRVFDEDMRNLVSCDELWTLNYGRRMSTGGTSFEIGYASATKKRIICLSKKGAKISLMVRNSASQILDLDEFLLGRELNKIKFLESNEYDQA